MPPDHRSGTTRLNSEPVRIAMVVVVLTLSGARCAQHGIDDHRYEGRVQPDLERQSRDGGVRHRLRNHDGAGGESGDQIGPQPRLLIIRQPFHDRKPITHVVLLRGRVTCDRATQLIRQRTRDSSNFGVDRQIRASYACAASSSSVGSFSWRATIVVTVRSAVTLPTVRKRSGITSTAIRSVRS